MCVLYRFGNADTMSFAMVATNTQNPAFEHLANIYGLQGRKLPIFIVQKESKTAPIVREWLGMFFVLLRQSGTLRKAQNATRHCIVFDVS